MSAPAAKALVPSPRTTRTLTRGSSSMPRSRPGSSRYISRLMALRLSGRSRVSVATAPARSTFRSSDMCGLPSLHVGVLVEGDALGVERLDLCLAQTRVGEDVAGVLAQPGSRALDSELQRVELGGRGDGAHRPDDGVIQFTDHATRVDVRVGQRLLIGEHRPAGHACAVQRLDPLFGGAVAGDVLDLLLKLVDVGHPGFERSEEHTSELQSRGHLVCRLLLEKKKKQI